MSGPISVGIDFDNTLAEYDAVIHAVALASALIDESVPVDKRAVRDRIRQGPQGELAWQSVQGTVYGPRIEDARPAPGVKDFLVQCRKRGIAVAVISHKTEFASADRTGTNLRQAAMAWLEHHRFFDDAIGLDRAHAFFESTRGEKLRRIGERGCTHFVDDLLETFLEPAFPPGVRRVLYAPHGAEAVRPDVVVCEDWHAVARHVVDGP